MAGEPRMRNFAIQMLVALACLYPGLARAADCALKIVNTIPIQLGENGTRVFVSVVINGAQKKFLLDTGGAMTQISANATEELKLPIVDSNIKMLDLYGNASTKAAKVDTFVLGRLGDRIATYDISRRKHHIRPARRRLHGQIRYRTGFHWRQDELFFAGALPRQSRLLAGGGHSRGADAVRGSSSDPGRGAGRPFLPRRGRYRRAGHNPLHVGSQAGLWAHGREYSRRLRTRLPEIVL